MLTSWVAEPLLSGPGAGGYMLVAGAGEEPVLLDFFVSAPGQGYTGTREPLLPIDVSFGDANQVFNVGAASVGVPGNPVGVVRALERWGTVPLPALCAPAAALARTGVRVNAQQAYIFKILSAIFFSTPEARSLFAAQGRSIREGDWFISSELGDCIERLGAEGSDPFYTGDVAAALAGWVGERGGALTLADLAAYDAEARAPVQAAYRGRDVLTNPPPSAGGILLALAMARLDATDGPPSVPDIVAVMEDAQSERTTEFVEGLGEDGFADTFMASRLGSTTHISVLDGEGRACSVTCTNGEGSGVVVPGTGVHLNNIMGEADLNPMGFHHFPAGRRMPSMMAPTVVLGTDGGVELVLGSAGSNRIRSAILQTIVGVVDHGLGAQDAVGAPRVHFEDGVVYAEPGAAVDAVEQAGYAIARFKERNLFFGGVQAVARDPGGELRGGADPRRGGGVAVA
jgi:gamma-glutamyltranspeptidase/glutathione hydrolase